VWTDRRLGVERAPGITAFESFGVGVAEFGSVCEGVWMCVQFKFPCRLSVRWPASAMLGGVARVRPQ